MNEPKNKSAKGKKPGKYGFMNDLTPMRRIYTRTMAQSRLAFAVGRGREERESYVTIFGVS